MEKYNVYQEAFATLKKFESKRTEIRSKLDDIMNGNSEINRVESAEDLLSRFAENVEISSTEEILQDLKNQDAATPNSEEKPTQQYKEKKGTSEQAIDHLEKAHDLIKPITGLSTLAKDIQEKAHRLKHKHFTVALFGAFSACLLYTSPSPRDGATSRMPSSA